MKLKQYLKEALNDNKLHKMLFMGMGKEMQDLKLFLSFAHYVSRSKSGDIMYITRANKSKTPGEEIWHRVVSANAMEEYFTDEFKKKLVRNWTQVAKMINSEWDTAEDKKKFVKK